MATAAAVLTAIYLPGQLDPPTIDPPGTQTAATGWGWDRPGALDEALAADQYMSRLADSAEEWFKKRPETSSGVATRIAEFRPGCSTLILASHEPLVDEDREWLVGKCRAWAARLDAHLIAIEAGEASALVLAAADETINNLKNAIRKRSEEIATRLA